MAGRQASLATPIAIVVAGALIAAGLYFGLRRDARNEAGVPAPAQVTGAPAPAPAAPAVSTEEVARQAAQALEGYRAKLIARCWEPAARARPTPPKVKLTFDFTFGADGSQIGRGVSEDRNAARPEVTSCVLSLLPPIRVPAEGASVRVEVPFALP